MRPPVEPPWCKCHRHLHHHLRRSHHHCHHHPTNHLHRHHSTMQVLKQVGHLQRWSLISSHLSTFGVSFYGCKSHQFTHCGSAQIIWSGQSTSFSIYGSNECHAIGDTRVRAFLGQDKITILIERDKRILTCFCIFLAENLIFHFLQKSFKQIQYWIYSSFQNNMYKTRSTFYKLLATAREAA